MRLYNVLPRESIFNWPDKAGKMRKVEMLGQWLGTAPTDKFVPIFIGADEPNEDQWGVVPSETNRPKIVSNNTDQAGVIAYLSSYQGAGHAIGDVLVHDEDLDGVMVIGVGTGGSDDEALRYREYLVVIKSVTRFLVLTTKPSSYTLTLDLKSEIITPHVGGLEVENYVSLSDQSVPNWRHFYD